MSKKKCDSCTEGKKVLQLLFSKKYKETNKISELLKKPRFWGALMGELIGTMLLTIAFMTIIGVIRADLVPLILFGSIIAIYATTYSLSGAHLNPIITAGAMATRRLSVTRGIFYILAQFIGAWLGLLILILFKNGSGSSLEVPTNLIEVSNENFWLIVLIELMGAVILGFLFARASRIGKKEILSYVAVMASCVAALFLLGAIISQNYFEIHASLVFNPASASAYPIFSNITEGIGQIILVLLAYFIVPMVGGIVGAFISDLATYFVGDGYICNEK